MEDKNKAYGKCRCCLAEGDHRFITKEYLHNGLREIYFDMMNTINLNLSQDPRLTQLICSDCVNSLRDADRFHKMVANTEQLLIKFYTDDNSDIVETKATKYSVDFEEIIKIDSDSDHTQADCEITELRDDNTYEESVIKEMTMPISKILARAKRSQMQELKSKQAKNVQELIACNSSHGMQIVKTPNGRNIMILAKNSKQNGQIKVLPNNKINKADIIKRKLCQELLVKYTKQKPDNKEHYLPRTPSDTQTIKGDSNRTLLNIYQVLKNSTLIPFKNSSYFYCYYCKIRYISFLELRQHCQSLHDDIKISDITLSSQNFINVDISNLKCKICSKELKMQELIEHLQSSHDIKFFESSLKPCNLFVGFDMDLANKCHLCDKEFSYFRSLGQHMSEHVGTFVCDICAKKCITKEKLKSHIHRHGPKSESNKKRQNDYCKNARTNCPICPQSFTSSGRYKQRLLHMETAHGIKSPTFKCDQCEKIYSNSEGLASHKRMKHRIRKQYECNLCEFITVHADSFQIHTDVHNDVKRYKCEFCEKRFRSKNTRKLHVKVHLNDKSHLCSLCPAAFIQKISLKKHLKSKHPECDEL